MRQDRETISRLAQALREKVPRRDGGDSKALRGGRVAGVARAVGRAAWDFLMDSTIDTGSGPERLGDRIGQRRRDAEVEALQAQYPQRRRGSPRFDGVYRAGPPHPELRWMQFNDDGTLSAGGNGSESDKDGTWSIERGEVWVRCGLPGKGAFAMWEGDGPIGEDAIYLTAYRRLPMGGEVIDRIVQPFMWEPR